MDDQIFDNTTIPDARDKYYYEDNETSCCNQWTYLMVLVMTSKSYDHQKILGRIKYILSRDPSQVNKKNEHGWSALMLACKWINIHAHTDCIKILIDAGANVNDGCINGETALVRLLQSEAAVEYFVLLLESGADCNICDNTGSTLWHYVCKRTYGSSEYCLEIATTLIKYGCNLNIQDCFGKTPLMHAINRPDSYALNLFLSNDVDVNLQDEDGNTVLMLSINNDRTGSCFFRLCEFAPDPNLVNNDGYSVLALLCNKNGSQLDARVAKLLEIGADINVQDNRFKVTPLMHAIQNKNVHHIKLLLDKGADIEKMDIKNETALFKAVISDNLELIKLLVDKGTDIEKINSSNQTVLFISVSIKKFNTVKLLISLGANINIVGHKGIPLIHYIFYNFNDSSRDIIKYLMDNGINANIMYNDETALMLLCKFYKSIFDGGYMKMVQPPCQTKISDIPIDILTDLVNASDLTIVDSNGLTACDHYMLHADKIDSTIVDLLRGDANVKSARKV